MLKCPSCGQENFEGTLFCEQCGYDLGELVGDMTIRTRTLVNDPADMTARATWGTAQFHSGSTIILHVRDAAEPLMIEPARRLIFGRSDENTSTRPDVDLSQFGGHEKGVSRQHAVLEINEDTLILMDTGSSNGTYLNGQRLAPNQPRVLRDGDEVRFGKLVTYLYFK